LKYVEKAGKLEKRRSTSFQDRGMMAQYIFDHTNVYMLMISLADFIKREAVYEDLSSTGPATQELVEKLTAMADSGSDFLIWQLPDRPKRED
jgi:hypothetical protein